MARLTLKAELRGDNSYFKKELNSWPSNFSNGVVEDWLSKGFPGSRIKSGITKEKDFQEALVRSKGTTSV